MAKIGLIGFGGGNALAPVIERETVRENKYITQDEFDKDFIVANITPGALPIEIASGVGRKVAGIPGMVGSAVCMGLPGALLTFILLALLAGASGFIMQEVRFASVGIAMLIVYILCGYTVRAVTQRPKGTWERKVAVVLVIVVFLLTCGKRLSKIFGFSSSPIPTLATLDVLGLVFFAIFYTQGRFFKSAKSPVRAIIAIIVAVAYLVCENVDVLEGSGIVAALRVLMVCLAVYGFVRSLIDEHVGAWRFPVKKFLREAGAWVLFMAILVVPSLFVCPDALAFIGNAVLSTLMSFGGGDAYLVFGQGVFVDTGLISSEAYYGQVVTVSNAMPGSIIAKVLTGVGYILGGAYGTTAAVCTAIAGFGCGVGMSGFTFLAVTYIYEEFESLSIFTAIRRYIRPVIGGLLLTVALSLVSLNLSVASTYEISTAAIVVLSLIIICLLVWVGKRRDWGLGVLIVGVVVVALIGCNLIAYI
jgi:chromate transporter